MSAKNTPVYRFGVFEFDSQTAELRKNGVKLKLQDQPSQVLVHLLECAGQLIDREELRSKLWPKDTFVDFENGLNTAVRRLRETLSDSAENPVFIETMPRKGYRFIAPVEVSQRDGHRAAVVPQPVKRTRKNLILIACIAAASLPFLGMVIWRSLPREPSVTNVVQLTSDGKTKIPMNPSFTDGVHLYYVEGRGQLEGIGIAQLSTSGGETTQVATPLKEPYTIYDIYPNFSELLIANGTFGASDPTTGRAPGALEVWAQPLPAGTPHRVGNIYATGACYTPDGMQLLYADGRSLITINRDGSSPRELAKIQGVVRWIRYSPDGKRIRFSIESWPFTWTSELWEIDAKGNNLHRLLPNWKESPFQCCGNWSPDGNYYFFQAGHGNDQAIWAMPEHRLIFAGGPGSPSRLITGPLRLSAPVPSPDGRKLFVTGEQLRVEPVRYDLKSHRFESYLNGLSTNVFEFSPDRNWIAYVSYPEMSLWRSRVDGTDKMQLTFPPVRVYGPRWSPDGSRIAFADVRFDGPWTVSLISSSGGAPQSFPGVDANWLPDGRSLIYVKAKDLSTPEGREDTSIFRMDLDSGKNSFIAGSETRRSPRVSLDGRYICAVSQTYKELSLFDSKTNRWSSLAKGEKFDYNLWSHDGKYVYVRDYNSGSPRIVRVRIPDGRMEEVVSLRDFPQPPDLFAGWFGLTLDREPILIRDRSVQEIYSLDLRF